RPRPGGARARSQSAHPRRAPRSRAEPPGSPHRSRSTARRRGGALVSVAARIGAIRPDPKDLSPLRIDEALVRKMLVAFLREETAKSGHRRVVVAVSGGIDSAAVAALACEASGPRHVTALFMPYKTSSAESAEHARLVAQRFG